jgi:hypothetical protein
MSIVTNLPPRTPYTNQPVPVTGAPLPLPVPSTTTRTTTWSPASMNSSALNRNAIERVRPLRAHVEKSLMAVPCPRVRRGRMRAAYHRIVHQRQQRIEVVCDTAPSGLPHLVRGTHQLHAFLGHRVAQYPETGELLWPVSGGGQVRRQSPLGPVGESSDHLPAAELDLRPRLSLCDSSLSDRSQVERHPHVRCRAGVGEAAEA